MNRLRALVLVSVALVSGGCISWLTNQSSTSPDPTPAGMAGRWISASDVTTLTNVCTKMQWTVTDVTGSTASGPFSATCAGTVIVTGTAKGTLATDTLTWSADGTAPGASGAAPCPVTLTGTGTFDGTYFRIPYTGTACGTAVTGAEILKKG